jgi:hypothetical protein
MVKRTARMLARARTRDSTTAFSKLAQSHNAHMRIVDQSPLIVPIDVLASGTERPQIFNELQRLLRGYRSSLEPDRWALLDQYQLTDFAQKVVGVGSVGTVRGSRSCLVATGRIRCSRR